MTKKDKKKEFYFLTHVCFPGQEAHKVAILEMVEAFSKFRKVNFIFFIKKSEAKEELERKFNNNVKLKGIKTKSGSRFLNKYIFERNSFVILYFLFYFLFCKRLNKKIFYIRSDLKLFLALFFVNKIRKIDYILEIHNFSFSHNKYNFIYKKVMERAKLLVTVSYFTKEIWTKEGITPSQILVLPSGVDLKKFNSNESKKNVRIKKSIPLDKKIVLYCGQLLPWKGIDTLINSFKYVESDQIILYIIGGETSEIEECKKSAKNENVFFLGYKEHEEIPDYMRAADILVLPNTSKEKISQIHTSPIKLFEYMASGNPVVAADLPSIKQWVTNREVYFFEPDNEHNLFKTINKALSENSNFSLNKKKIEKYSWTNRAKIILEFLK